MFLGTTFADFIKSIENLHCYSFTTFDETKKYVPKTRKNIRNEHSVENQHLCNP